MKKIKFLMIGGFLGAGKTTAIARLAAHYSNSGKTVGIVTNDQAYNLVDTHTLRSLGFSVGEVAGACFCCKFDDLIDTVSKLSEQSLPDVVIAEPVGSCTDLYATVIQPMRLLFGDRFNMGPLIVLLKPEHGRKILGQTSGKGFSPQAEYIFLKQLEEADAIVINKIDKLPIEQQADLTQVVSEKFDGVPIIGISARDGTNFDLLVTATEMTVGKNKRNMDVDYETYAAGEAELGWLNCQIAAASEEKFDLDLLVLELTRDIGMCLAEAGVEVAHLKVLGQTVENAAVANLVSSSVSAELSLASEIWTSSAELLVNARVATAPDRLVKIVTNAAERIAGKLKLDLRVENVQSFRPAKPEPTHRTSSDLSGFLL